MEAGRRNPMRKKTERVAGKAQVLVTNELEEKLIIFFNALPPFIKRAHALIGDGSAICLARQENARFLKSLAHRGDLRGGDVKIIHKTIGEIAPARQPVARIDAAARKNERPPAKAEFSCRAIIRTSKAGLSLKSRTVAAGAGAS